MFVCSQTSRCLYSIIGTYFSVYNNNNNVHSFVYSLQCCSICKLYMFYDINDMQSETCSLCVNNYNFFKVYTIYTYCTHNRTQYKQLHTKFIHLLHKVGVGTSQDGTKISSDKCLTEVTIEISQRLRYIGIPMNG